MTRKRGVLALGFAALLVAGCARHFVVERDVGRVDGARSIATSSDTRWTIEHEPTAGNGAAVDSVDAPERVDSCELASQRLCKARGISGSDLESCVAERLYDCVSRSQ